MDSKMAKICFEHYTRLVEDVKETSEIYHRFCSKDSEYCNESNFDVIETAIYKERENAFYAGFHEALCVMLNVLETVGECESAEYTS